MDWIIESAEGDILLADLEKDEAIEKARSLTEARDEPVSVQNIQTGQEIVYLPGGETEQNC
ncbi:MAG: hypothetical protein F4Y49_09775 [Dehalococcoidia bacterium]|nr:hypothetical protein [Dehalococcoidia bacterium]